MAAPPPSCVPVEPVRTNHKRIEQDIVNHTHGVEYALHVFIIGIHRHVFRCDEVHERCPIIIASILDPCPPPRFHEVHKMTRLVIVFCCKVQVIHFFTVLVNPPIFAIQVEDAAFIGSLIDLQVSQMTQGLHVSIANVTSS